MSDIGALYDQLLDFNQSRKDNMDYPIHKSLNYTDSNASNLYEYLLEKDLIEIHGDILDCGCGVGFGSIMMASQDNVTRVHGISLSDKEIATANINARSYGLSSICQFEVRSFDDLEENQYDAIVCIESLKHSPDLHKTMQSIGRALKPDGQCIIIDDIAKEPINSNASRRQMSDWVLEDMFTLLDYQSNKDLSGWNSIDLTSQMALSSKLVNRLKILSLEFLVLLGKLGIYKNSAVKIMRGGAYQDMMYHQGQLKYKILTCNKKL